MSTHYLFYLGYRTKDEMFHLLGPYDKNGKVLHVYEKSHSFIGNLPYDLSIIPEDRMDEEIKQKFAYEDYKGKTAYSIKYIPVKELPDTDYIKSGYYLAEEVFENLEDNEKYFSEHYTFKEYSIKLQCALANNDTEELNKLKKFIFYSYPDYASEEYTSFILNTYFGWDGPFNEFEIKSILGDDYDKLEDLVFIVDIC